MNLKIWHSVYNLGMILMSSCQIIFSSFGELYYSLLLVAMKFTTHLWAQGRSLVAFETTQLSCYHSSIKLRSLQYLASESNQNTHSGISWVSSLLCLDLGTNRNPENKRIKHHWAIYPASRNRQPERTVTSKRSAEHFYSLWAPVPGDPRNVLCVDYRRSGVVWQRLWEMRPLKQVKIRTEEQRMPGRVNDELSEFLNLEYSWLKLYCRQK